MEYEFINDPITGSARAKFSLEQEVFGPWLEVEVGHSIDKMTELLTAVDSVDKQHAHELLIVGSEYNALISKDDVIIRTNAGEQEDNLLAEAYDSEELDYDQNNQGSCGIEDFRQLLKSWSRFIK